MKNQKGFTLIELMIVVVIIGILAAMAIPRWWKASERSRQSEARLVLKQIYTNQRAHFQAEDQYYITGAVASSANPSAFETIMVEIMDGALYEYRIAGDATSFVATATANLDDDGTIDTWTITDAGTLSKVIDDTAD
jgi:type IV pilus assembly protein PilE